MNFAQLNNSREKQYVDMASIVVLQFGEVQTKQWANGGVSYEQPCLCQDGPGEQKEVWSTSKFPDPSITQSDVGKPTNWKMKWFTVKGGTKICGYSLKPQQMGGTPAPAPAATYQPQQQATPPPQAAPVQNTYHPTTPPPRDYDKENRGKCRLKLYEAHIGGGISAAQLKDDWPLLDAIEVLVGYSMDGLPAHDEDGLVPDFASDPNVNYGQNNPMSPNV